MDVTLSSRQRQSLSDPLIDVHARVDARRVERRKESSHGRQEPRIQVVNPRDNRPGRRADLLVAIAGIGAFMVAHHRAWTLRSISGSGLAMA